VSVSGPAVDSPGHSSDHLHGRVVVGIDHSAASRAAVAWGADEAQRRHAPLHLITSWSWQRLAPWSTAADRMMVAELREAAHVAIDAAAVQARNAGASDVTTEVREGEPADVVIAESASAGLLVVGTHRLTGLARAVLGSTSTAAVLRATCPVVVVAERPTGAPQTVLVGVGGTEFDERVLSWAFGYAQRHGATVRAVHAWHMDMWPDSRIAPPEAAHAWLSESLAGWREDYPDVMLDAALVRGQPVEELVRAAGPHDLIVVGRRKRRSRLSPHPGSVSLGVLHHAPCSVAVVA
jgi:nucleotide-binding universal stress UspA family protein